MDEEITLIVVEEISKSKNGFPEKPKELRFPAYAEVKDVTYKEFYEARRNDVEATIVFEMRQEDWEQSMHDHHGRREFAAKIEHEGYTYEVIRAYRKGKAKVQVTCK